jgi:hypothetical protein
MSAIQFDSPPDMHPITNPPPSACQVRWRKWLVAIALNVWLCYHLFAIIICPASVAPATPIVQAGWSLASGYLQLLYLNHGFHFFAPDPTGSSLIRCELEFPDKTTRTVQYPNRNIWPRLLYHRHFMLTEFLGNGPTELRPYVERAMARQLCRATGAESANLFLLYHDTASVTDILAGKTLNEPASFTEEFLGSYLAADLSKPYQPPLEVPAATLIADEPVNPPDTTTVTENAGTAERDPPVASVDSSAP